MDLFDLPPGQKGVPQKSPYTVRLEAGRTYYFCQCGRSKRQPFCDGLHTLSEFGPLEFTVPETKDYHLCGCKHTNSAPHCDGSHSRIEW